MMIIILKSENFENVDHCLANDCLLYKVGKAIFDILLLLKAGHIGASTEPAGKKGAHICFSALYKC